MAARGTSPGLAIAAAILTAAVGFATAGESASTVEECDARVRDHPDRLESFHCYLSYSESTGNGRIVRSRLEDAVAATPGNPRAALALAAFLQFRNAKRANELGLAALEGFEREGNAEGQAWAHYRLLGFYSTQLRLDEAAQQAERALEFAEAAGATQLGIEIKIERARLEFNRGDLSATWLELRRLEVDPALAGTDPLVRTKVMQLLAQTAERLGLAITAHSYARRAVGFAEESGNSLRIQANLVVLGDAAAGLAARGEIDREEALAAARRALKMAVQRGKTMDEIASRMTLANCHAAIGDHETALEHLRLAEQASLNDPFCRSFTSYARMNMGNVLLAADPSRAGDAIALLQGAVEAASEYGTRYHLLETLLQLVDVRLQTGPADLAIETGLDAIDAIESLTDGQSGEETGARLLAALAPTYHALIDFLLEPAGHGPTEDETALAFAVSERLRARRLLAHLETMRVSGPVSVDERRGEILAEISRIQLERLVSELSPARRDEAERELRALELEEETLRGRRRHEDAAHAVPRREELVTLERLVEALGDDEALLDFVVTPGAKRSWLIAVSRAGVSVRPLADHATMQDAAGFWLGVLQRGDNTEGAGAAHLYRELFGDVLRTLPPSVERLVIVPDGPLHGLPFDALRESEDAAPLIAEFQIALVPSATFWLRLRDSTRRSVPQRALLLADPAFVTGAPWPEELRGNGSAGGPDGRLPYARDEARSALRSLRGDGELLLGADASEAYLKQADLGQFGVLHVAAHTLFDDHEPSRSAILLSPGGERQDGLLQAREIVDLDLGGALVTLSACRSAEGVVMTGEGVMGLARSFFQARADAVVGALWPLRDRDTAVLMAAFYRHIGAGSSVAGALAEAKREMVREGKPASAWAGLVVLGSGDKVPWPVEARRSPSLSPSVLAVTAAAVLLALVAVLFIMRRR